MRPYSTGLPVLVVCLCVSLMLPGVHAQGFDGGHYALQGDWDGDGLTDLYVTRLPALLFGEHQGKPAQISAQTPIADFVLTQQTDGSFAIAAADTPLPGTASADWPRALLQLVDFDVNADGLADLVLTGLGSIFPGADDLIVYAPATTGAVPAVSRPIDASMHQFFRELYNWAGRPSYFEETAPYITETISETAWTYLGYLSNYAYPTNCYAYEECWYLIDDLDDPGGYDPVDDPEIPNVFHFWGSDTESQNVLVPDYSIFNPQVLAIANAFGQTAGIQLESPEAQAALEALSQALGVPYGPQATPFAGLVLPRIGAIILEESGTLLSALRLLITSAVMAKLLDLQLNADWLFHYTQRCEEIAESRRIGRTPGKDVFLTPDIYFSGDKAERLLALEKTPTCLFIVDKDQILGLVGPQTVAPNNGQTGGGIEYVGRAPVFPENRDPIPLPDF